MSVMRYTFASTLLHSETSLVITMPEAAEGETLPFPTAVLLSDVGREADCFLRREPLERFGCTLAATVSLSGQLLPWQPTAFVRFLTEELPMVLSQFPLQIRALYSEGQSAAILQPYERTLERTYPTLCWQGTVEALLHTLKGKEEPV